MAYCYTPPKPYKSTLPPWFYPPASPYSTLTKSFYRLVKEKIITHRLLKRLLYPEYTNLAKFDLTQVKRRKHKTECFIRTGTYKPENKKPNSDSDSSSDESDSDDSESNSDSDDDNNNSGHLHRQNAVIRESISTESCSNISGSTESNPFGFIRYFNSPSKDSNDQNQDDASSFIDHGSNIEQPRIINSFCVLKTENSIDEIIIPVSEVSNSDRTRLGALVQSSQESGNSSFDCAPSKSYMACEDLLNIDESTEIEESLGPRQQYVSKTRHSLPTKFVANKFNKSSLTLVYIPQWQSNSESNLAAISKNDQDSQAENTELADEKTPKIKIVSRSTSINDQSRTTSTNYSRSLSRTVSRSPARSRRDSDSSSETTTHSSCLDIPVNPLPVPDAIVAEILYNSGPENLLHSESIDSDQTEVSSKTVIKPPVMFRNPFSNERISALSDKQMEFEDADVIIDNASVNLRLSNISFNKHSINSDKRSKRQSSVSKEVEEQSIIQNVSKEENPEPVEDNKDQLRQLCQAQKAVVRRDRNKTVSLRKCVSYHYLQLAQPGASSNYGQFCRCCTEPCSSRRSSDSGMAGSCTLNSPDLALTNDVSGFLANREHYSLTDLPNLYGCINPEDNRDVVSLSEMEARNFEARDFEAECRCTSPFGSTPRTSCQASTSDNIVGSRDSTTSMTSSTNSDTSPFPTPCPWESENQIYEKVMSMKREDMHMSRRQQLSRMKQKQSCAKSKSCENFQFSEQSETDEEMPTQQVYRSGLYAHWWMKAKLPNEVIRGIFEESNSSSTAGKGLDLCALFAKMSLSAFFVSESDGYNECMSYQ